MASRHSPNHQVRIPQTPPGTREVRRAQEASQALDGHTRLTARVVHLRVGHLDVGVERVQAKGHLRLGDALIAPTDVHQ
jgi:hypothetical protein